MIGLQAHAEAPSQTHRGAKDAGHPPPGGHGDQVLVAHQLADGGDHLRREARAHGGQSLRRRGQQPVAKGAHGQMADRREGGGVVAVQDQPGDLVGLVGDQGLGEKRLEGRLGQGQTRGHPLALTGRRHPGQLIARPRRRRLRQKRLQILEYIPPAAQRRRVHGKSGLGFAGVVKAACGEGAWRGLLSGRTGLSRFLNVVRRIDLMLSRFL